MAFAFLLMLFMCMLHLRSFDICRPRYGLSWGESILFLCHINDLPDSVTSSIRWLFVIQDNQNSKRPPKTTSRLWNFHIVIMFKDKVSTKLSKIFVTCYLLCMLPPLSGEPLHQRIFIHYRSVVYISYEFLDFNTIMCNDGGILDLITF
jgi:hypothetical protein